jgi:hypothetical protein
LTNRTSAHSLRTDFYLAHKFWGSNKCAPERLNHALDLRGRTGKPPP